MIESLGHLQTPPDRSHLLKPGLVHFTFDHREYYRPETPIRRLCVLVLNSAAGSRAIVSDQLLDTTRLPGSSAAAKFDSAANLLAVTPVPLDRPFPLEPVCIPKPWGQEVWFTGIEERGLSCAGGMPVAWLMDVFREPLGSSGPPLLLKILDPHPEPNLGDLYFEMHREKIEVYVVTGIDGQAWPDGQGAIRYGFNPAVLQEYDDRESFLRGYTDAVRRYEVIRRQIDQLLAEQQSRDGIKPGMVLTIEQQKAYLHQLPEELIESELALRSAMYAFTDVRPLGIGDVVTVENFVPHSLQHGVRVVEFQTPHYERYILSFGQQVLTQSHWDTEQVFEHAETGYRPMADPRPIARGIDLITDFEAFHVLRVTLEAGEVFDLSGPDYRVVMGISGELRAGEHSILPETAFYVPPGASAIRNETDRPASFLVAMEGAYKG